MSSRLISKRRRSSLRKSSRNGRRPRSRRSWISIAIASSYVTAPWRRMASPCLIRFLCGPGFESPGRKLRCSPLLQERRTARSARPAVWHAAERSTRRRLAQSLRAAGYARPDPPGRQGLAHPAERRTAWACSALHGRALDFLASDLPWQRSSCHGAIRPTVTASKKSITAAVDATAQVLAKSTGVPFHAIPDGDLPGRLRLQ